MELKLLMPYDVPFHLVKRTYIKAHSKRVLYMEREPILHYYEIYPKKSYHFIPSTNPNKLHSEAPAKCLDKSPKGHSSTNSK